MQALYNFLKFSDAATSFSFRICCATAKIMSTKSYNFYYISAQKAIEILKTLSKDTGSYNFKLK